MTEICEICGQDKNNALHKGYATPTMSDDMVVRVARAIYDSHEFVKDWDHPDTQRLWHECMRAEARAAIKAMREPNEQMLFMAHRAQQDKALPLEKIPGPALNRVAWKAMVDSALDE